MNEGNVVPCQKRNTTNSIKRNAIQYVSNGLNHSEEKLRSMTSDIERVVTAVALDQEKCGL